MDITVKGMSRWSIQKIKAMLLCIEYVILFVDTVDMKIKACNALNVMFVETVDTLVFVTLTEDFKQSTMRCENYTLLCIKCINSINIDSIECIRDPCPVLTVSTYIIDGMVEKPSVSAFQNFLQIENQLNIKKVMGRNVWMCFVSTVST